MMLHAAFFAIDCLAIFLAILFAAGLLVSQPRSIAARIAALILVNSAGFVVFSRVIYAGWIPEPFQLDPGDTVPIVLQVMMNTTPGLFMMLCFFLFLEPGSRFPRWLLALFVLQVALEDLLPNLLGVTTRPSRVATMTDDHLGLHLVFETLPTLLQALFAGTALYWTLKDWRADLVEMRRRLRLILMIVSGASMATHGLVTRLVQAREDIAMLYLHEAYIAFAVLVGCAVILFLLRFGRVEETLLVTNADIPVDTEPAGDPDYAAFQAAMDQRIYHEAGLTVAALASRLNIPEYRLRRLINRRLGYRNFNHMLHAYRVADAVAALEDPEQRHLPILSIALSTGYQSINPFNRAFRDITGTTPSAFRQRALSNSAG